MNKLTVPVAVIAIALLSFSFTKKDPSPSSKSIVSKSLVFPVSGKRSNIGSFWGDVRDGGKRKHRGIDIFAKKGTPVVAISDGIIVHKGNTPRGGKTLWMRAIGQPWTVYYAHLDQQKVKAGQFVKKGDVLGTVGNTGNARTTPAHLHFGIYSLTGAINPLPYVKHSPKITVPAVAKHAVPVIAKSKTAKNIQQKAVVAR
jgi:murein DD-endopeptidase MepM/ murein hydrolase activator NlpD